MKTTSNHDVVRAVIDEAARLYQTGHTTAAADHLATGIHHMPDNRRLTYALTEMLIDAERYQDGLDALARLPAENHDCQAAELQCYCLEGLQRYDEAESVINPFLDSPEPSAAVMNLKGILSFHRNDKPAAADYFERSIQTDPACGRAYVNLGLLRLENGDAGRALELIEKGFALAPHVRHVSDTYHDLICQIGAFDRAETLFKDACRRYPLHKKLSYLLIDILLNRNQLDESLLRIQTALATFGADDGILEPALKLKNALGEKTDTDGKGSISLCMIVKNEEQHLARCLESVRDLVGEMVIVDTGSSDRSRDIARVFGARVYSCEWQNNFSFARNLSLSNANKEWILVLDADEVLAERDIHRLRTLTRDSYGLPTAYSFVTRNYTDDSGTEGWRPNDGEYKKEQAGLGWNPSEKVRLFPNDSRIRFENPIHELVEPSLRQAGVSIDKCPVPIHHYGILNPRKAAKKKADYYSLGQAKLARKRGDIASLAECAIQAAEVGEYAEAVNLWQHILTSKPDWPKAHFNLSYAYIQLENYREGEAAAREAIRLDPHMKEAGLNYALCLMRLGQVQNAIECLERFQAEIPDHPMALGLLAVARAVQGNTDKGIELFRELKAMGFDCRAYILDHARKFLGAGRKQQSLSLLTFAAKAGLGGTEITVLLNKLSPARVGTDRLTIHIFDLSYNCPEFSEKLHALKDFTPPESRQFAISDTIHGSDFVIFPFSIDPLYHQLGHNDFLRFLENLKGFKENEHKFVFFLMDDISSALGIQSVIFRVNHDIRRTDMNSITLPYFVEDIFAEPAQREMRYHVNFVGTVVTHLIRAYMLLPFLQRAELTRFSTLLAKLQRLLQQRQNEAQYDAGLTDAMSEVRTLFPIDPVIGGIRYFFDISVDQFPRLPEQVQRERKARLVNLINQSMTTLCPRGFGVQSIRFFETLSAGRIPILISDHYRLPLEGHIDYSGLIWKIEEDKIMELPGEIETIFKICTDSELIERANAARQTWQQYFAPCRRSDFMYLTLRDVLKRDYCLNG